MPHMNGLEVLRRIRLTHSPDSLPVIMCTANNQTSDIVQAMELGANDYVAKPIDFAVALARVNAQVQRKRASEALAATNAALLHSDDCDRGECDFPRDFARTLPGTVFMQLMGLPMERREEFFEWEETFFHGGTAEDRRASGKAIEAVLADLVEARRADPKDDLMSMLVHATFDDGTPVPYDDVMDMCWLLYIAGLDTVHAGLGPFLPVSRRAPGPAR